MLQLVARGVRRARATRWSRCAASWPPTRRAAALLVGLGVRELSVGPAAVPRVKQAVRALDVPEAAVTARAALAAGSAAAVRARLQG